MQDADLMAGGFRKGRGASNLPEILKIDAYAFKNVNVIFEGLKF